MVNILTLSCTDGLLWGCLREVIMEILFTSLLFTVNEKKSLPELPLFLSESYPGNSDRAENYWLFSYALLVYLGSNTFGTRKITHPGSPSTLPPIPPVKFPIFIAVIQALKFEQLRPSEVAQQLTINIIFLPPSMLGVNCHQVLQPIYIPNKFKATMFAHPFIHENPLHSTKSVLLNTWRDHSNRQSTLKRILFPSCMQNNHQLTLLLLRPSYIQVLPLSSSKPLHHTSANPSPMDTILDIAEMFSLSTANKYQERGVQ